MTIKRLLNILIIIAICVVFLIQTAHFIFFDKILIDNQTTNEKLILDEISKSFQSYLTTLDNSFYNTIYSVNFNEVYQWLEMNDVENSINYYFGNFSDKNYNYSGEMIGNLLYYDEEHFYSNYEIQMNPVVRSTFEKSVNLYIKGELGAYGREVYVDSDILYYQVFFQLDELNPEYKNGFVSVLFQLNNMEDFFENIQDNTFALYFEDQLLHSNDDIIPLSYDVEFNEVFGTQNVSIIQNKFEYEDLEFSLLSILDQKKLKKEIYRLIPIGVFFGLFAAIILHFLMNMINRSISGPIESTVKQLKMIDEDQFELRLDNQYMNEIGIINDAFNITLDKLKSAHEESLKANQALYEATILQKETELKFYQNQINPHFLYNTLENLRSIGKAYGSKEVEDISSALANIFRYSTKGEIEVDLSKEVACAKEYFKIISIRYPNCLYLKINIEERFLKFKILKMILQPIIENSIKYCLKRNVKSKYVSIKVKDESEDTYRIEVVDNGIGISEERLCELKEMLGEKAISHGSIGLNNINNRIVGRYGDGYEISLESREHYWTKVIVKIPKH